MLLLLPMQQEHYAMKATFQFDSTALNLNPSSIGGQACQRNIQLGFTLGDTVFHVEPQPGSAQVEIPAKTLRQAGAPGSGLTPVAGGFGPHQDYLFMRDSVEYTYTTRELTGGGVIEKQMPVGAIAGQEGRMILYKGCTSISDCFAGNWTARLVRPFLITAADLTARDSGWPATGAVPTVDVTNKLIVDNAGDGYNHV